MKFSIGASASHGGASLSLSFNGQFIGSFTPSSTSFQEVTATFAANQSSGQLWFTAPGVPGSATAIDKVAVQLGGAIGGPRLQAALVRGPCLVELDQRAEPAGERELARPRTFRGDRGGRNGPGRDGRQGVKNRPARSFPQHRGVVRL